MDHTDRNLYFLEAFTQTLKEKIIQLIDNIFEEFLLNLEKSYEKKTNNEPDSRKNNALNIKSPKPKCFETENEEKITKEKIDEIIHKSFRRKDAPINANKSDCYPHLQKSFGLKYDLFTNEKKENFKCIKNRFHKVKNDKKFLNYSQKSDVLNIFCDWQRLLNFSDKILDQTFTNHEIIPEKCLKVEKISFIFKNNQVIKTKTQQVNSELITENENDLIQEINDNDFLDLSNNNVSTQKYASNLLDQSSNFIENFENLQCNSDKTTSLIMDTQETFLTDEDTYTSFLGTLELSKKKNFFLENELAEIYKNIIMQADLIYKKIEKEKDQNTMNIAYLIRDRLNDLINCIIIKKKRKADETETELRQILDFYKIYTVYSENSDEFENQNFFNEISNDSNSDRMEEMHNKSTKLEPKSSILSKPPPFPRSHTSLDKKFSNQKIIQNSKFEQVLEEKNTETSYINKSLNFNSSSYHNHIYGIEKENDQTSKLPKSSTLILDVNQNEKFGENKTKLDSDKSNRFDYDCNDSDEQISTDIFELSEDISSKIFTEINIPSDSSDLLKSGSESVTIVSEENKIKSSKIETTKY